MDQPVGGIGEIQQLHNTLAHVAQELEQARDQMRNYAAAITQGQEDERARVARELHDETVQTLIALELQAHLIQRAIGADPENATRKAKELGQLAQEGVQDLRRMIYALRPLYLDDLGWLPAVQALVSDLEKQGEISTSYDVTGQERRLEPAVELALFRIAQEAIRNAARHSKANHVDVRIAFTGDHVLLSILDDGNGFMPIDDPQTLLSAGHYGLVGMYERAQLIGAELDIESVLDQGTRVAVTVR
jgi:signal transduction histidine kinase